MASLSYNIDTSFQSKKQNIQEPIEKVDMIYYTSTMKTIDKIMDENKSIMKELETEHDEVVKKIAVVKTRVSAKDIINDNNIILGNRPKTFIASANGGSNSSTKKQKHIIEKINMINFVELERKKIRFNQRLYLRYLQNLKRIRIETIEREEREYMAKILNRYTIIKLAGTAVSIGISMMLISSITLPSTWVLIGKTMTENPFTFNIFTDIFYNFGIFNISDVANVKNLYEMFLIDIPNNPLLKNSEYIKLMLETIFTPVPKGKKIQDILNETLKTKFPGHNNDNSIVKLFLTIQTIINGKNIFDPNRQLILDQGWFEFVSNAISSPHISLFYSSCKLAYNVIGYVDRTVDILQSAPNIDSSIILKEIATSGISSISFLTYTNIFSSNFIKHIVGNKLDEIFIATPFGDLTGNTINQFFVTTLNGVIATEITSRVRGYFVKIETEAGYIKTEERMKQLFESNKNPIIETEILIRKIGKESKKGLTNEEIIEAVYPNYDKESEYKSILFKNLDTFYKTFKKTIKHPETFLYALTNVTVIYNGLINIFYTGLFGASMYAFQRMVLTGWAESQFFSFKYPFDFKASILNFLSYILPFFIGSDQYLINKFSLLKREGISNLIHDIDILVTKVQSIFFDTRIGMSVTKFLRKVNNTILGSIFTTTCKIVYNIVLIPQFQQLLHTNIPDIKIKIGEFVTNPDKIYKFFAFLNHRISNIYNIYYTTIKLDSPDTDSKLKKIWKELKKIGNVGSYISDTIIPYINADNIYEYDSLNVSNLKGNLINIIDEKCQKPERLLDEKCIDKKYIIVNRDLQDNFAVINYEEIEKGLKQKLETITSDLTDDIKNKKPTDVFYMYYYTKFINLKKNENSKYNFNLKDFKDYMLKEADKLRRENNQKSSDEIGIEFGIINNVMVSIEEKFQTSFLKDMGFNYDVKYDSQNFIELPKEFQYGVRDFLNDSSFKSEEIKKSDMLNNNVIITIFTPTSYGYLPQTIKANDFYDFIDILKGLNVSDLTGSAVEQLSRLEYQAEQDNDYEIKSDLALLNSNFKEPCRIIYRNIAELDKGFIKRFPDQDINLPLSDLGFDYALFKQKMEGLIQGITDKPSLDEPIVAKFLVKLLDINDIKISDILSDYSEELLNKIFTPEMLIKFSLLTDAEIENAISIVAAGETKLKELSPEFEKLRHVTQYLKSLVSDITNVDDKKMNIFDIMYQVIESQDKSNKPELASLYNVLKEMIPKMHNDAEIRDAIKQYFSYITSPLKRQHIVDERNTSFNNIFNETGLEIDEKKRQIEKKIQEDNFKDIDLSDPTNILSGGLINIDTINNILITTEEKEQLRSYKEIVNRLSELKKLMIKQGNFFASDVSIESGQNEYLDEYKELRTKWLNESVKIYTLFRKKQAFLLYEQINKERGIVNNQIKEQMESYKMRLNTLYLKHVVKKNKANVPNFQKPTLQQQQQTQQIQQTQKQAVKPTAQVMAQKSIIQDPQQQMRLNEVIKNQSIYSEKQAYLESLGIAEDISETLDEKEIFSEDIGLKSGFGGDSIFQTFFSFFSDMLNKIGTKNVANAQLINPEEIAYKEFEKKEKNALEVCEQIHGKWVIYKENYRIFDASLDVESVQRCNQTNLGEMLYQRINQYYKIFMTSVLWGTISASITSFLVALGLLSAKVAGAGAAGAAAGATSWASIAATAAKLGTIGEFFITIISISTIGIASPQGALLFINYIFIYLFSNNYKLDITSKEVNRKTNIGIKFVFSLWHRYYKNLMKLYTIPGTNTPDYDKMCSETGCKLLAGIPNLDIPLTFQDINEEADRIMGIIYGENILPNDYNVHGDIDLGQKTGDINYSNLKYLIPEFISSNFITSEMKINYELLVEKKNTNKLICSDLKYSKDNVKIAVYSFFQNMINPKNSSFLSDFLLCNILGRKDFSLLSFDLFLTLWHIFKNPGMFLTIITDIFTLIIINKKIRPFILTFFFGKPSAGQNINAIRDVIDKELSYLESLATKENGELDNSEFETLVVDSIYWDFFQFFASYNNTSVKLFQPIYKLLRKTFPSIFGKDEEEEEQPDVNKWDTYDEFLKCFNDNCSNLKKLFLDSISKMQTDVFNTLKDSNGVTYFVNIDGNIIIDRNGKKLAIFNLSKINDDKYVLDYIANFVIAIENSQNKLKYKNLEEKKGDDYLAKYKEILINYKTNIEKKTALDKFIREKIKSENNPFLNFALNNYLNGGSAIAVDLIYICNNDEMLVYNDNKKEYSCKKIDVSNNIIFNEKLYSGKIQDAKNEMLDKIYGFINHVLDINSTIDSLCSQGLCDEIGNKYAVEQFLKKSTEDVLNFRSGTDNQEEMFTKLEKILETYKNESNQILKAFSKKNNKKLEDEKIMYDTRNAEYNDPNTTYINKVKIFLTLKKISSNIEYLEETNELINEKIEKITQINVPDDIKSDTDFNTYFYLNLLNSIDVTKNPYYFAYAYLSYFNLNSYGLNSKELERLYDEFSEPNLDTLHLRLPNGKEIFFPNNDNLNAKLANKKVMKYIKYFAANQIKKIGKKSENYVNKRNATHLQIKEKGKPAITEIKSTTKYISALTGINEDKVNKKEFDVLFNYGYYFHKKPMQAPICSGLIKTVCKERESSKLILLKTRLDKKIGDPKAVVENIIDNLEGNNKGQFIYNSQESYDSDNKFDGALPPILVGLNIDSKNLYKEVKKFVIDNYKNIDGIWISKQDLELYKYTFKDFDEKQFIESIRSSFKIKDKLKDDYFSEVKKVNAKKAERLKELEKEKQDVDAELKQNAANEQALKQKLVEDIQNDFTSVYKTNFDKVTKMLNDYKTNITALEKEINVIKTNNEILFKKDNEANKFFTDLETKLTNLQKLLSDNKEEYEELNKNFEEMKKLVNDTYNLLNNQDKFIELAGKVDKISQNLISNQNAVEEAIDKVNESKNIVEQYIEWSKLSMWQRGISFAEKGFDKVWQGTKSVVKGTVTLVKSAAVGTYKLAKKGVSAINESDFSQIIKGNKSLKQSLYETKAKIAEVTSNLWYGNLSDEQQKHLDTLIGVEFTGFNNLELNIISPFPKMKTFGDFKQEYDKDEEHNGIYNDIINNYYYFNESTIQQIKFKAVFNYIFSPHVISKPFANGYYDVNLGQLFYNSDGMIPLNE